MSGHWPRVRLGEVLKFAAEPHWVDRTKDYPNLGIYSFGRGLFAKPPINGSRTSATTLYRVRAGQFIYSRLFSFEGAFGVVPTPFDEYYVSNEFPAFDCNKQQIDSDYLRWLFSIPSTWKTLAGSSVGMGNRRQRIQPETLMQFQVALPPLPEQRRIVARLDAVAAVLAAREAAAKGADAELDALLRAAFTRVTEGAPRACIRDIAPLVRRAVKIEARKTYTEIGVRSFYKGIFHRRAVSGSEFTWQKLFYVRCGDLVFSNLMAWEKAIAVASRDDDDCVGNHRMLTCAPDTDRITSAFLFYYFQTPAGFGQVLEASPGTAVRNKTLSVADLPNIAVPLPSLNAQRRFDRLQAEVKQARVGRVAASAEAAALLPALLRRAFA